MYFHTISKILFCNIILCSFVQASQGGKQYYYNQFVNYNDEYIFYSITDSQNIHTSKSVTLTAFDLTNKRNLKVNCTIKEGHFFKVRLFSKPAIKFIAAPIKYTESDPRSKLDPQEKWYIPVATDKEVFLAEIKKNGEGVLYLELVEKINTHNSPIYSLHSFSTSLMQGVISSSLYPSIKKWTYDNGNATTNKTNFVGGVCLGQSADLSYIYVLKDVEERNAIQRWLAREKSDKKYNLYRISEEFDDNDETKFVQWEQEKLSEDIIQLTEPGIFTSTLYETPLENILEGLFFYKNDFYACLNGKIKKFYNSVTDIKQLFYVHKPGTNKSKIRTYDLIFLLSNKVKIATLTQTQTKDMVNFTLTDFKVNQRNNQKIIGGCLNKNKTGLHILFTNENNTESTLIEFSNLTGIR